MQPKSEIVLKNLIPSIRVSVAKELATNHNFNQLDIAELLGITQAAVSKYLNGNYSRTIKSLENSPRVKKISNRIVGKIVLEKKEHVVGNVCELCKNYSGNCLYKHFAMELSEALKRET